MRLFFVILFLLFFSLSTEKKKTRGAGSEVAPLPAAEPAEFHPPGKPGLDAGGALGGELLAAGEGGRARVFKSRTLAHGEEQSIGLGIETFVIDGIIDPMDGEMNRCGCGGR